MPYDDNLADRIRKVIAGQRGWTERKMFGGLAFLLRGSMCCGVSGQQMMVRVGAEGYEKALARPHVRPMDFTGRPMRGFVYVEPPGTKTVAAVRTWIALAAEALKPTRTKKKSAPAHSSRKQI